MVGEEAFLATVLHLEALVEFLVLGDDGVHERGVLAVLDVGQDVRLQLSHLVDLVHSLAIPLATHQPVVPTHNAQRLQ